MIEAKSQPITKRMVWEAYKKVRSNRGSAGIDKVSLIEFEAKLSNNLYKIWNRLASGSYFPPPVKEVSIPKPQGGDRKLGIPTVGDRVAQMVVKDHLEPLLEPEFDSSSYGYRPNKSAHEAIGQCRLNCRKYAWVIDLDIKGFFDTIDHKLMMKALQKHTTEKWLLIYAERWLKAPVQEETGKQRKRDKGTPQGGVISPLLANLFLHYAFDKWMRIHHSRVNFERYADDIIIHSHSKQEAERLLETISKRMETCGLQIHPEKSRIAFCKSSGRGDNYGIVSFDFLGYTFKPRRTVSNRGAIFLGFNPGVSKKSLKRMNTVIKQSVVFKSTQCGITDIARELNPKIRGWLNYYGKYRRSDLNRLWEILNNRLIRWARKRFKRLKRSTQLASNWIRGVYNSNPTLFLHWKIVSP